MARMKSQDQEVLRPTLWRTCRVLANRTRLRVLHELSVRPEQRVSDVAQKLGLSLSLTSQSLRALNARGLLAARRSGRSVWYSTRANPSIPDSARLLQEILKTFAVDRSSKQNIFRYATAFTHPRRILIMKTLYRHPMKLREIAVKTGVPIDSLTRHLRKLIARGFLKQDEHRYVCSVPQHHLARFLQHLAVK